MGIRVPGQSSRSAQLQTLAQSLPMGTSDIAKGQQEAQKIRMQQAVGQATQGGKPMNASQIQQSGAQQATAQAAPVLQKQQTDMQQAQQVGQMGLQQQGMESQKRLSDRKLGLEGKARELKGKLNTLGNNLEDTLVNQQMDFQRDEMGRTFFNERQLADWAMTKMKSEEDFRSYEQKVSQASKKRSQMLKTAYSKIQQTLKQGYDERDNMLDNNQKRDLILAKQALEKKMKDEANKQANRAAMFGAAGAILGGVAGGVAGGPAGAMAGASAGQGLGSLAASQTEE